MVVVVWATQESVGHWDTGEEGEEDEMAGEVKEWLLIPSETA